jgi:hypothetical protein
MKLQFGRRARNRACVTHDGEILSPPPILGLGLSSVASRVKSLDVAMSVAGVT